MREAAIPRHIAGCANPDACRFRRRLLIDVHDRKHHPPRVTVRLSAALRRGLTPTSVSVIIRPFSLNKSACRASYTVCRTL